MVSYLSLISTSSGQSNPWLNPNTSGVLCRLTFLRMRFKSAVVRELLAYVLVLSSLCVWLRECLEEDVLLDQNDIGHVTFLLWHCQP